LGVLLVRAWVPFRSEDASPRRSRGVTSSASTRGRLAVGHCSVEGLCDVLPQIDGVLDDPGRLLGCAPRLVNHGFEIRRFGRGRRGIAGCHTVSVPIAGRPKRNDFRPQACRFRLPPKLPTCVAATFSGDPLDCPAMRCKCVPGLIGTWVHRAPPGPSLRSARLPSSHPAWSIPGFECGVWSRQ